MPENLTRGEIQDLLMKFSKSNPTYREALLKNPRAVVEGQMGGKLPAGVTVKAVEETPTTIYVVVPYVARAGDELSDGDLEAVAGGAGKGGIGQQINAAQQAQQSMAGLLGGASAAASHGGGDTYTCSGSHGGQNTRVEFNAAVTLK